MSQPKTGIKDGDHHNNGNYNTMPLYINHLKLCSQYLVFRIFSLPKVYTLQMMLRSMMFVLSPISRTASALHDISWICHVVIHPSLEGTV